MYRWLRHHLECGIVTHRDLMLREGSFAEQMGRRSDAFGIINATQGI